MPQEKIRVTQVKSANGCAKNQRDSLRGLGLRRMHQAVEVLDTCENRGMIRVVEHMLRVEEAQA